MNRKLSTFGALGAVFLAAGLGLWAVRATAESHAAGGTDSRPVVVELFTSQGCSSCPPADALLSELTGRPDLLALSFHIDYWDYIGWKDPFASAQYTGRQRDYAAKLGLRYVYTPQMVIDGRHDAVGSNRRAVTRAIEKAAAAAAEPAVTVTLAPEDGGRAILSPGEAPPGGATVWLVTFDDGHDTQVARGENRGRALHNSNVVRELTALGTWRGEAQSFALDLPAARAAGRGGCAVIVQDGRGGPVLGAAKVDLDASG
jgi:hypothetical protein